MTQLFIPEDHASIIKDDEKSPWGLVLILFGAGVLSAFQVGKMPPVLPDIRLDLGISLLYAGWLLSIFNFTGLLMGTLTGSIADTIGHRRLLITGLCLQITGCICGSFTHTFSALLATRFLEGSGFLAVAISTPTLIFQVVRPKDLKMALSLWSCYFPIGGAAMMVLVPLILKASDWRGLWQVNAALLIVYTLLLVNRTAQISFKSPSFKEIQLKKMIKNILRTATHPGPVLLSLSFIAYAMQWLAVIGFLPTLIMEKYGFSNALASVLTAFMVFVNIFGNLAGGWLLQTGFPRWKLMAYASAIMGTSAFMIYSSQIHFLFNYTGCLIFSVCSGLIPAAVLSGAPVYAPSKNLVATTNGLIIQGGQTGQFLGPPIMAFLVSQTGTWSCGAWFLGSVAFFGFIVSLMLSRISSTENI